jgi:hypothetical protein
MEVMGLMLGQFVDDYSINVVDVFAMPQVSKIRSLYDHVYYSLYLFIAWFWCQC